MIRALAVAFALSFSVAACSESTPGTEPALAQDGGPLALVGEIPLGGLRGRLDRMSIDSKRGRLFIAARSSGTLEVVDLAQKKLTLSIEDIAEAQGVLYIPEIDRVLVSSGALGNLQIFDGETLAEEATLDIGRDADEIRYDALHGRVLVAWGEGAIAVVDPKGWKVVSSFALTGHPSSFELHSDNRRLFACLPSQSSIAVIDREQVKRIANFDLSPAGANYPLALMESEGKIAVGCREPSKLFVVDLETGAKLESEELSADVGDLYFDANTTRLYAICGDGYVDVFEKKNDGLIRRYARTKTSPGARTGLLVAATHTLYVAAPARSGHAAAIQIYEVAK